MIIYQLYEDNQNQIIQLSNSRLQMQYYCNLTEGSHMGGGHAILLNQGHVDFSTVAIHNISYSDCVHVLEMDSGKLLQRKLIYCTHFKHHLS
jgi:hypothetical protein